jgi:hypothetical protein
VASGYEKDACGAGPDRGWDLKPRWPWVQALMDRALLICGCLLSGAMPWSGWEALLRLRPSPGLSLSLDRLDKCFRIERHDEIAVGR